jgi:hypothetical protein
VSQAQQFLEELQPGERVDRKKLEAVEHRKFWLRPRRRVPFWRRKRRSYV